MIGIVAVVCAPRCRRRFCRSNKPIVKHNDAEWDGYDRFDDDLSASSVTNAVGRTSTAGSGTGRRGSSNSISISHRSSVVRRSHGDDDDDNAP
jgi:hypothetical protein